jgi:hypothetical protein
MIIITEFAIHWKKLNCQNKNRERKNEDVQLVLMWQRNKSNLINLWRVWEMIAFLVKKI